MIAKPFPTLLIGLAGLSIASTQAIEAPADNTPPPAMPPGVDHAAPPPNATTPQSATAFLGVVSAGVPEMLAAHLGLKPGAGIVVQALMPNGPAAKAGVAVYDVITHVADHPVESVLDLTRQVATHQPGESIRLKLIHHGQPSDISVTLSTRPGGLASQPAHPLDQLNLDDIPKDLADRIRRAIQDNLGDIDLQAQQGAAETAPQIQDAMREMKKRMQQPLEERDAAQAAGEPKIEVQQGAAVRLMDELGSIELKSNKGGKEVTIRDKENKITWSGPWDTEQDKAAAPPDVRQRVERLNIDSKYQGNGLRLRFHGTAQPNE